MSSMLRLLQENSYFQCVTILKDHSTYLLPPDGVARRGFIETSIDPVERQGDDDKPRYRFVAATENGVRTFFGPEHLDMDGADLSRFNANPVVLDSHNRERSADQIGRAVATIRGRSLEMEVEFASEVSERAREVEGLVKGGYLRGMSIGFIPRKTLFIEEGEIHSLGDQEIVGPAHIVTEWELFEASITPVPADPSATRRSIMTFEDMLKERLANRAIRADEDPEDEEDEERQEDEDEEEDEEDEERQEDEEEDEEDEERQEDEDEEEDEERSAIITKIRTLETRKREILAFTPKALRGYAENLILDNPDITVGEARDLVIKERDSRSKTVGTDDPADVYEEPPKPIDKDVLKRSLRNL